MLEVKIKRLDHAAGLPLPKYESADAAGFDLCAAVESDLVLEPRCRALVPTGFCIQLPKGYEGQVRPRSGLAVKNGITLVNSPGTVDADYRGEIMVPLINLGQENFIISRSMRIAQMIIAPVQQVNFCEVSDLDDTIRGADGFGSTGA